MDRRLLVLALGLFAFGTDGFAVAGTLPQIAHGVGVAISAGGQTTALYTAAQALLSPTIAALAAGVDRKRLLLWELARFVIANLATAAAPAFAVAPVSRRSAQMSSALSAQC
ncbi:MAG: hypothetical protein WDN69_36495 [Aliidongia sp.]